MGYKNVTITLPFEDLGEGCVVVIRNPKLMPPSELQPDEVAVDPTTGQPKDPKAAEQATYGLIASLIVSWNVWDATVVTEDAPLLGDPTAEAVAKLPIEIINRISEEIQAAFPSLPTP